MRLGIVALVVCAALKAAEETLTPLVRVIGDSMNPTYKDGEVFLSHVVLNKQSLNVGDVVVILNPCNTSDHYYLVKRISAFQFKMGLKKEVWVLGDNSGNSMDSREFGWVPIDRIKCVAFKSRPLEVSI